MIDQFSAATPAWLPLAQTACNNWHNFSLPAADQPDIWCHWSALPNDTYDYMKWSPTALPLGIYALTFNCDSSSFCSSSLSTSMWVWYSEIRMERANLAMLTDAQRTFIFAHEMGHTLGLAHHSNALMNTGGFPSSLPQGPTSVDYGQLPPCSGAYSTFGVRCVFNITN
jgi:hypothetical protein